MKTCKACRKPFKPDTGFVNEDAARRYEYIEEGVDVAASGIVCCGYGSAFDMNWYKFTLVPGWYCWKCLDDEIKRGLCQPLLIHVVNRESLDRGIVKRYNVRGVEWKDGRPT